jgi:hypothetical protein
MSDLAAFGRHVGEVRKLETAPFRWRTPWNDADPVGSAEARMRELRERLDEQSRDMMRSALETSLFT